MRRREFITLLGGLAGSPLAAHAQQSKLPTIGYLGANTPSAGPHWVAAFVQRLGELGWIDGRNLAIEYRWAEDRSERFAEIAAEFVRLKVDVILAHGTQAAIAAKQATAVIPIVATPISDPLSSYAPVLLAKSACDGSILHLGAPHRLCIGKCRPNRAAEAEVPP
jgi:putative ABC transport system substrate-binding protein